MIHVLFDLLAAVVVLIVLGGVMLLTKLCSDKLSAEVSRKIIHVTMGCVALALPFIITYKLTVVCLGVVAVVGLLFLRVNKSLRDGIGSALLGITRKSFGELYFVCSIVIVFVLHESTFEYLIPISVLTFADSAAALVGTSYGRSNLAHTSENAKSSEGSVMFFIVAFICTLVPLQLMTDTGRAEVLAISFLIGLLAAMIEVVSTDGNDNLLLPLLTYSFVRYNSGQTLDPLVFNFAVMLFFLVAILLVYRVTNLSKLSIAYCLLVGYIVMIQGGAIWVFPPLMLLLAFGILPMMKSEEKHMIQTYKVVECNAIVGLVCLWLAVFFPQYRDVLHVAFSLSFACFLAINTYSRFVNFVNSSKLVAIFWGLAKAIVFIALPTWVITKMNWLVFMLYLVFLAVAMPPTVSLNMKYDYKNVGDNTFRANKILVGTVVAAFAVLLVVVGRFYDIP